MKNQKSNKHVPMRTCVACRKKVPKRELVRFAVTESGELVLDQKGKIAGRGASICPDVECFELAVEKGLFKKALKHEIANQSYKEAREAFGEYLSVRAFRQGKDSVVHRVGKKTAEDKAGELLTRDKQQEDV